MVNMGESDIISFPPAYFIAAVPKTNSYVLPSEYNVRIRHMAHTRAPMLQANSYSRLFTVHLPIFTVHLPIFNVHLPIFNVHLPIFTVHIPIFSVHLPIFAVF